MRTNLLLLLLLAAFWVLLSGHFTAPLFLLGACSTLLVFILASQLGLLGGGVHTLQFYLNLIKYIPWLIWRIMLSNIKVAYLILQPKPAINPKFVRMPLMPRTSLGQVGYANSITLTPGTISVDIDENSLEVHVLAYEAENSEEQLAEIGRRVVRIERQD